MHALTSTSVPQFIGLLQVLKLGAKVEAALDEVTAEAATSNNAPPGRQPVLPPATSSPAAPPSLPPAPAPRPAPAPPAAGAPLRRDSAARVRTMRKVEIRDLNTG